MSSVYCTQRNRNPFVDYPWLIGLFELSPGLPDLYQDCSVNYTGDPNNCGHTVDVGTDAPSVSPGTHTPSPTTVADANSVGVGGIAVIALNSGMRLFYHFVCDFCINPLLFTFLLLLYNRKSRFFCIGCIGRYSCRHCGECIIYVSTC